MFNFEPVPILNGFLFFFSLQMSIGGYQARRRITTILRLATKSLRRDAFKNKLKKIKTMVQCVHNTAHALQNPTLSLYKQKSTSRFILSLTHVARHHHGVRTKIKPEVSQPIIPSVCFNPCVRDTSRTTTLMLVWLRRRIGSIFLHARGWNDFLLLVIRQRSV